MRKSHENQISPISFMLERDVNAAIADGADVQPLMQSGYQRIEMLSALYTLKAVVH